MPRRIQILFNEWMVLSSIPIMGVDMEDKMRSAKKEVDAWIEEYGKDGFRQRE